LTAFLVVACTLLGVPAGAFVNLLVDRVPAKQGLRPWTFWPLARTEAGRRLGLRYPLVEAVTAALFAATAVRFAGDWVLPAYLVFFASLVAISVIDFDRQIIPNRIVYPTIFLSIPLLAFAAAVDHEWGRFGHSLLGATLAWGFLLVIHLVSPAGMGFGDVRLAFVLGLFLGWLSLGHVVTGLFLGIVLISVVGLVLAALRLRSLREHIAFGPFLAGGSMLAVFAGGPIMRWWLGG
jgi:leader peptidase (prepilin peptidase)/N-methyltransferase